MWSPLEAVRLSLLWRSCAITALRLEAELLRLRDSRYVPVAEDFTDGAGLAGFAWPMLFRVEEAGFAAEA